MICIGWSLEYQVRIAPCIMLSDGQFQQLNQIVRSGLSSVRLWQRAQIILLAAQGFQNKQIAQMLGIGRVQVARWRSRYLDAGIAGIERDLPRGAPPLKVDLSRLQQMTTQSQPQMSKHWSTRKMAAELGVSPSTVMRHWHALGLKPHLAQKSL